MTSYVPLTSIAVPGVTTLPAVLPEGNMVYDLTTETLYISDGSSWNPAVIPGGVLPVSEGGTGSGTALVGDALMISDVSQKIIEGTSATNPSFTTVTLTGNSIFLRNSVNFVTLSFSAVGTPRTYTYADPGVTPVQVVYDNAGSTRITNLPSVAGQILGAASTVAATWQANGSINAASAFATSSADVNVSLATAPGGAGYSLVTTDTTHAIWQSVPVATGGAFSMSNAPTAGWFIGATSATVAAWMNPEQFQSVYLAKTGNDANSGTSIGQAVLTMETAITRAAALVPGAANVVSIICLDGGNYSPTADITFPDYTVVTAPAATLTITDGFTCTFGNRGQVSFYKLVDNTVAGGWGFILPYANGNETFIEAQYFSGDGGFFAVAPFFSPFTRPEPYIRLNYVTKSDGILFGSGPNKTISADVGVCKLSGLAQIYKNVPNLPTQAVDCIFNFEVKTILSTTDSYMFDTGDASGGNNVINCFSGQIFHNENTLWDSSTIASPGPINQFFLTVNKIADPTYTGFGILQMNDTIFKHYTTDIYWNDDGSTGQIVDVWCTLSGRTNVFIIGGWYYGPVHSTTYITMPGALSGANARVGDPFSTRIVAINGSTDVDATAVIVGGGSSEVNIYYGASAVDNFPSMAGGGFYSFCISYVNIMNF